MLDVARGVQIAAIGVEVGVLMLLYVATRGPSPELGLRADARVAGLLRATWAIGLASAGAGLLLWPDADSARAGWLLALSAWMVLGLTAWGHGTDPGEPWQRRAAGAAGVALALVPALVANAAKDDAAWLVVPANVLHVAAAGTWAGGVLCLLVIASAGRGTQGGLATAELTALLMRFSGVALLAVVAIALSGVLQGLVLVGRIDALVTTGYGRIVAAKALLLCGLAGLGALQRGRTLPELQAAVQAGGGDARSARKLLQRLLGIEVAMLVAVFALTGLLAATTPSTRAGTRVVVRDVTLGRFTARVRVSPAAPGVNRVRVDLRGAGAGRVTAMLVRARQRRLGIGPIDQPARAIGAGRFEVRRLALRAPGTWELTVIAGRAGARVAARLDVPLR